jgi:hypothetical protein
MDHRPQISWINGQGQSQISAHDLRALGRLRAGLRRTPRESREDMNRAQKDWAKKTAAVVSPRSSRRRSGSSPQRLTLQSVVRAEHDAPWQDVKPKDAPLSPDSGRGSPSPTKRLHEQHPVRPISPGQRVVERTERDPKSKVGVRAQINTLVDSPASAEATVHTATRRGGGYVEQQADASSSTSPPRPTRGSPSPTKRLREQAPARKSTHHRLTAADGATVLNAHVREEAGVRKVGFGGSSLQRPEYTLTGVTLSPGHQKTLVVAPAVAARSAAAKREQKVAATVAETERLAKAYIQQASVTRTLEWPTPASSKLDEATQETKQNLPGEQGATASDVDSDPILELEMELARDPAPQPEPEPELEPEYPGGRIHPALNSTFGLSSGLKNSTASEAKLARRYDTALMEIQTLKHAETLNAAKMEALEDELRELKQRSRLLPLPTQQQEHPPPPQQQQLKGGDEQRERMATASFGSVEEFMGGFNAKISSVGDLQMETLGTLSSLSPSLDQQQQQQRKEEEQQRAAAAQQVGELEAEAKLSAEAHVAALAEQESRLSQQLAEVVRSMEADLESAQKAREAESQRNAALSLQVEELLQAKVR